MAESKTIVISYMSPGVANDGGGWVIINGKLVRVPPRSPNLKELAAALNLLAHAEGIADKKARTQLTVLVEPIVAASANALAAEVGK